MIERNDPCWCGSPKKWKHCHYPKQNESLAQRYFKDYRILIKTPEQIEKIKRACSVSATILRELARMTCAGMTTNELDLHSRRLHAAYNAIPAPLGYGQPPYPKSICTSLNDVICHGIPDDVPLKEGDILNIDVSSIVDGFFGDCSCMVAIGAISQEKRAVMNASLECLQRAIAICRPGVQIRQIGQVIEEYAASLGFSVVNQFVGHGIGIQFHEPPEIPHHYNQSCIAMVPGMTFTIEPMINAGVREGIFDKNQWTVRTRDGRPSAQWEHTLVITESGHEVLTY